MQVDGVPYRTIWLKHNNDQVIQIIDQRLLPHKFVINELSSVAGLIDAITEMQVRGAGLIGVTAAFGMYLAVIEASKSSNFDIVLNDWADRLKKTRPTAVNLAWAVNHQLDALKSEKTVEEKINIARSNALRIADENAESCRRIGEHGVVLISKISKAKQGEPVNILTHCNAGWLAFTDYGSATAPIYEAQKRGIEVHVWVDETRPRNQGASLTAWELGQQGIPHTVIPDNTGGHLMQHGLVDMVITGADRVTRTGDVANKIGTYLKALAAHDNQIPFFVALPSSTIDWEIEDGLINIPIEERDGNEVKYVQGWVDGEIKSVLITPVHSSAKNFGFDVTPSRLITGIITERGISKPTELKRLYPEAS